MRILVTYLLLIVMIACTKEATSKVEENNSKQQNMVIKAEYTDYYHPYMTYVAGVKRENHRTRRKNDAPETENTRKMV